MFRAKLHCAIRDFSNNFGLLQFHFDRWLYKTVSDGHFINKSLNFTAWFIFFILTNEFRSILLQQFLPLTFQFKKTIKIYLRFRCSGIWTKIPLHSYAIVRFEGILYRLLSIVALDSIRRRSSIWFLSWIYHSITFRMDFLPKVCLFHYILQRCPTFANSLYQINNMVGTSIIFNAYLSFLKTRLL